jgi:hypothetical protein
VYVKNLRRAGDRLFAAVCVALLHRFQNDLRYITGMLAAISRDDDHVAAI